MATEYKLYIDDEFESWREEIKKELPKKALVFFTAKVNGKYISDEEERKLGELISKLNDVNYSYLDEYYEPIEKTRISSMRIALRMLSEMVFEYIDKNC